MTTSSLRKTHAQQTPQQTLARARRILRRRLPELRQAYGVQALWLFGLYVRGEARQQSDLDLLVQFDDRRIPITCATFWMPPKRRGSFCRMFPKSSSRSTKD
jgi:hypothetical protein